MFSRTTPKLVEELHVSIRDLRTILESLIELAPQTRDAEQLTEHHTEAVHLIRAMLEGVPARKGATGRGRR